MLTELANRIKTWVNGKLAEKQDALAFTPEPAFSKNTGFNKDFGTTAGTVCQGNDSRLSDARTPTSHTHDDRYYTETEIDTKLAAKMNATSFFTQTTLDIDGDDGTCGIITLSADDAWTFANLVIGQPYTFIVKAATATRTVTMPNTADVRPANTDTIAIPTDKRREFSLLWDGTTRFWQISEELT